MALNWLATCILVEFIYPIYINSSGVSDIFSKFFQYLLSIIFLRNLYRWVTTLCRVLVLQQILFQSFISLLHQTSRSSVFPFCLWDYSFFRVIIHRLLKIYFCWLEIFLFIVFNGTDKLLFVLQKLKIPEFVCNAFSIE